MGDAHDVLTGHLTLPERVAVLEASQRSLTERFDTFETKLDKLLDAATKQKGLIGGITLVVTGLVTVLGLFKDWIWDHVRW